MADLNSTIGSVMNNGVGGSVADAQQMAQSFGGAGNMNFGANTNLSASGTTELSADEKALAAKAAAMQKSKRLAWNNEHKILYLVMGNYALRKRVKPGVTTGRIKDPASQLDKILTAVWKEDGGRPANMVDGKIDGVVAVPACVSRIGESENYTKVINALVEAKNGGNDVLDVNLNGKPGQFKGVVVQTPEGVDSWTMAKAKEMINYNGQAKLQIQGITDGPQLQIKIITAKQVAAKKDKKDGAVTVNDVTQIQIPYKEKLVSTETCDIVDPAHVKVFNEIDPDESKAAVNDKYNASSVIGFRYERKPGIDSKDQKTKKMSRKIQLKVEMLAVVPSQDPAMAPFSPKSAVGQAVTALTDKQEEEAIAAMWSRMFELGLQTGDTEVDSMRAEAVSQKAQANAQEAQNAIGAGM